MKISDRDALLVIDAQPTFMPGGGLPVTDGDQVVPVIQRLMPLFPRERRIATKDRHPRGHISLASSYDGVHPFDVLSFEAHVLSVNGRAPQREIIPTLAKFSYDDFCRYLKRVGAQVLWPDHGIAGTLEAELHPDLPEAEFGYVLVKGTDPACDSYSAFRDNLKRPTELADVLREREVERVFLAGLAFDYCDGWSALDGVDAGFEVAVIEDATRPVGFPAGSVERMREALDKAGVRVIQSRELLD